MADFEIRSLRVSAQMDASQYTAGAQQKVAADKSMVASGQSVGMAVTETNTKISQAGDVLSRLSRQYVDGYAAAQRFNSALTQLSSGIERGKITAEQTGPILDGIYRKYGLMGDAAQFAARGQTELATAITRANAKLAEQRNLTPVNQNQGGLARFGALNAASQFQDIVVTAAMGQNPLTIALQQGTQLGQALQLEMGENGATGLVKGLGAAFASLLSPVNLLAIGLTGVAAVAIEFGSKLLPQIKSLKDATEDQRKAVNDLAEAYGNAGIKADEFYKKSVIASESEARRATEELRKSLGQESMSIINATTGGAIGRENQVAVLLGQMPHIRGEFEAFTKPLETLFGQIRDGRPNFDQFEKSISDIVANNPGLQTTGDKILGIVANATAAAAQLNNTAEAIKSVNRASVGNFDRSQQAGRDQSVMSQRFGDDPLGKLREQQRQKVIELKEAQDQRNRSLANTLDLARLDVDLVGKTTAEVEGLRMAAQLEAQVREEAARNNVRADETEIANIRAKAAEYGRLKAIEEARTTIRSQQDDIEQQRLEVSTIGQSSLARQRAIDALKAEQEIRKLGIPLYGQEAQAIRKNTEELSNLAEAAAKAQAQQELLFQIRQMGRSEADQSVASQLRSLGFSDTDLNSDIAKVIKMRDEIARMKDTWNEVFQTARDGIDGVVDALFNGGSISDALKNAGRQLARTLFDQAVTNPLKNWLTGSNLSTIADLGIFGNGATSGRGGGFGGVLGNLLGAQKAVASMQVQAASVFINGAGIGIPGVGSIGNLLGGNGSTFTPNTTLTDILTGGGGGAANQNYIQSRIDQAFGTASNIGGIFTPAGGFANVLGGSSLTGSMAQYASAIKGVESLGSGGYSALGPLLKNGNQALGAYQIMKSNLPSWSTEAFGSPMSVSDFMSNPAAQDAIFNNQFGKLLGKYGNPQDAASAWFTGGPLSSGAGKMDILGTTGSQYVDKFNAALSQATQNVGQLGGASSGALSSLVSSTGQAAGGLNALGSGAGKLGSMLSQFPAAPGGGGGGLGGLGGLFGSFFGGGGLNSAFSGTAAYSFLSANPGGYIGLYADGTENAPPGWAWVGEKGPELKKLRAGDVIRSNPRSVEMMKQAAGGSNDNIEATLRKLAPMLKTNVKNINVFDPSVVGDYLNTSAGEEVIMNVLRRNGK